GRPAVKCALALRLHRPAAVAVLGPDVRCGADTARRAPAQPHRLDRLAVLDEHRPAARAATAMGRPRALKRPPAAVTGLPGLAICPAAHARCRCRPPRSPAAGRSPRGSADRAAPPASAAG